MEGYDGDGGPVAADPDIVFAFSNENLLRTTNGGQTWFLASEQAVATGPVPVFGTTNATNPDPVVVTAQGHGFVTGGLVTITGVTGNTAANVAGAAITVLDANSFSLNGVSGNGVPHAMPRARGGSIGRGLPANAYITRVALAPSPVPGTPSSKIFVSMDHVLYRSTNGGITFVPMNNFTDSISALHAPADQRLWVGVSGLQNTNRTYRVRFSANDGASFDAGVAGDVGARSSSRRSSRIRGTPPASGWPWSAPGTAGR